MACYVSLQARGRMDLYSLPETYKRAASLEAFKRLMMKHDFARFWFFFLVCKCFYLFFLSCDILTQKCLSHIYRNFFLIPER